jgi:hypothetical protein
VGAFVRVHGETEVEVVVDGHARLEYRVDSAAATARSIEFDVVGPLSSYALGPSEPSAGGAQDRRARFGVLAPGDSNAVTLPWPVGTEIELRARWERASQGWVQRLRIGFGDPVALRLPPPDGVDAVIWPQTPRSRYLTGWIHLVPESEGDDQGFEPGLNPSRRGASIGVDGRARVQGLPEGTYVVEYWEGDPADGCLLRGKIQVAPEAVELTVVLE